MFWFFLQRSVLGSNFFRLGVFRNFQPTKTTKIATKTWKLECLSLEIFWLHFGQYEKS